MMVTHLVQAIKSYVTILFLRMTKLLFAVVTQPTMRFQLPKHCRSLLQLVECVVVTRIPRDTPMLLGLGLLESC